MRKQDYEQGEPEPWYRVLLAINDLKSQVSCFKKLLTYAGLLHNEPLRRPRQPGTVGKENARDSKPKFQITEKFTGTATKGKGKAKSGPAPSYLPVHQEIQSNS
jgi:hypothetical protein